MDDWLSVKQRQYQIYERESSSYKQAKITTQINPCILSVPVFSSVQCELTELELGHFLLSDIITFVFTKSK